MSGFEIGAAAGASAAKAGGSALAAAGGAAGVGAALSAFVVMSMTLPKDDREWRVALASTLASSLGGGAAAIMYFDLQHWIYSYVGAVALGGLVFACGLPGWLLIRAGFLWMTRRKDKDFAELAQEVARQVKEIKS